MSLRRRRARRAEPRGWAPPPTTSPRPAGSEPPRRAARDLRAARKPRASSLESGTASAGRTSWVSLSAMPVRSGAAAQSSPTPVARIEMTGSTSSGRCAASIRRPMKAMIEVKSEVSIRLGTRSSVLTRRSLANVMLRNSTRQRRATSPISRSSSGPPVRRRPRRASRTCPRGTRRLPSLVACGSRRDCPASRGAPCR